MATTSNSKLPSTPAIYQIIYTDNIVSLIERSDKLIFLISRSFLSSEWAQYDLCMGELKCFEEKKNLMVLVFIEDIPKRELPRSLRWHGM